MREAEVLIVGAGPAGAAAAINLAPLRRVVLVERQTEIGSRIGESLLPAARRLLADMGLLESFLAEEHAPWYGNRAVWGGSELQEADFLRDPDGHGWHLDRARFERWLREAAKIRGAELLSPATVDQLEHDGRRWRVGLKTATGSLVLTADLLIDAGGRAVPIARRLGGRAQASDRLVCAWVYGHDKHDGGRGLTYVEAVENGWWYTAPLPKGRRVLAFHSDADLLPAQTLRERNGLMRHADAVWELAALLATVGFVSDSETRITAAHSALLEPVGSENWLAVGDAAISFDPLSSQGLLNALFTGLAAAEAVDSRLRGNMLAIEEYAQTIRGVSEAYRQHLALNYAAEIRWPEALFWKRRCEL